MSLCVFLFILFILFLFPSWSFPLVVVLPVSMHVHLPCPLPLPQIVFLLVHSPSRDCVFIVVFIYSNSKCKLLVIFTGITYTLYLYSARFIFLKTIIDCKGKLCTILKQSHQKFVAFASEEEALVNEHDLIATNYLYSYVVRCL